jgi:hypothetical protein
MIINTKNKSYAPKGKYDPPHSSSSPRSSSPAATVQVPKVPDSQGTTSPLPSSKHNILNQLANIKVDETLLNMVVVPEQQRHLKQFMEGKYFVVANLSEEVNEEDSSVNKVGVHKFRYPIKNPPFYISVKIMDKFAQCCLIDDSSGPSVISKIIMEELGVSCTNENARSMLSYNSLQQMTIGEIKYVTSVLCAYPEIRTTLSIQVIDIPVRNYSIILGRDWKALTGGYLSLDGTHLSVPRNGKNIIVLREGRISPYIESVPQPNVNYIKEDLGVYSIFSEEDNIPLEQIDLDDGMWHMHFDGSFSNEGNKAGIILYSLVEKIHDVGRWCGNTLLCRIPRLLETRFPTLFSSVLGLVVALTRAEVQCVQKLEIVNGFGYRSYCPFHDLIYRYYYCERSKLQPLFIILERGEKPIFFFPSISEALLPRWIGFLETIFKEVHLRSARTRFSHNFSYRLVFACTNNVTEFKALLLGIENTYNLGCGHLIVFGDFELVVNLVHKIQSPRNKLMKRYTQIVWALI